MTPATGIAWRVFPWDPAALDGEPWSPTYVFPVQTRGRFDVPSVSGSILYLAETADHAVVERIRGLRGQRLGPDDLVLEGHRLALVSFSVPHPIREQLADLCRPDLLAQLDLPPDRIASRDRKVTQGIAARIHGDGWRGLRWWSAFLGEWHTTVLFLDRIAEPLEHGEPEPLSLDHPSVIEAAAALGIELGN